MRDSHAESVGVDVSAVSLCQTCATIIPKQPCQPLPNDDHRHRYTLNPCKPQGRKTSVHMHNLPSDDG